MNLSITDPLPKCAKVRKPSFSLFSCSRRLHLKLRSSTKNGSDSETSQYASENPMITYYSDHGFEIPHNCSHGGEVVSAFRNSEGNILSSRATPSCGSLREDTSLTHVYGVHSSRGEGRDCECQIISDQEPSYQPNCFPRALRPQKKAHLSDSAKTISLSNREENKLALSIPGVSSFGNPLCSNDSYAFYCSDNEDR